MSKATVFLSHRAEYKELAQKVKDFIQNSSGGNIKVFISEDIAKGDNWRADIEAQLRDAKYLFLIYGAPHEDWAWCFYETGYFAALRATDPARKIYCLAREEIAPPGPLDNLQTVRNEKDFINLVLKIYASHEVECDSAEVRSKASEVARPLFSRLAEFTGCPRIYFEAKNADFTDEASLPTHSCLKAERQVMREVFGAQTDTILWRDLHLHAENHVPEGQKAFVKKWLDETCGAIIESRKMRFSTSQTVLIGPRGKRFRFILTSGRVEGDGRYRCEFLLLDEVGGPAVGMSSQLLSLLTNIRMAFRFKHELLQRMPRRGYCARNGEERRNLIMELYRLLTNLEAESAYRGNNNVHDLYDAFDSCESSRIRTIVEEYWPVVRQALFESLGLLQDGRFETQDGLQGAKLDRFHLVADVLRLLNDEFLFRCCARVTRKVEMSEEALAANQAQAQAIVNALQSGGSTRLVDTDDGMPGGMPPPAPTAALDPQNVSLH